MKQQFGIWLVGAGGGVASTVAVGLAALRRGLIQPTALVSALPCFQALNLTPWDQWELGGHEIRAANFFDGAQQLANSSRAFSPALVDQVREDLLGWSEQIRPGFLYNSGQAISALADSQQSRQLDSPRKTITAIQEDLRAFAAERNLEKVIVINVSSTEPGHDRSLDELDWQQFSAQLDRPDFPVPASTLYAIATMELGFPHVNFTPSVGSNLRALRELAELRQTCHAGRDGKTGETFLKSVLAPAFAARNLHVMSWVGHNIFGNLDGKILDDPNNKATKVVSKDALLGNILGYAPQTHTSIEYISSLGDWKTAWDHIHFQGFLGTPMIMQFIWQGCDSILAAPLVLDLARFVGLASQLGEIGELGWLASFFKSPQGASAQEFSEQFAQLRSWTERQMSC